MYTDMVEGPLFLNRKNTTQMTGVHAHFINEINVWKHRSG